MYLFRYIFRCSLFKKNCDYEPSNVVCCHSQDTKSSQEIKSVLTAQPPSEPMTSPFVEPLASKPATSKTTSHTGKVRKAALSLGEITLPSLCVTSLSETVGHDYATHTPISGHPIMQATGPQTRELVCSITCHQAFIDPETLIEDLRSLIQSGTSFMLYKDETLRLGQFVLTTLSLEEQTFDVTGKILSVALSLTLRSTGG